MDGDAAGMTGWTNGGSTGNGLGGDVTIAAWIQSKEKKMTQIDVKILKIRYFIFFPCFIK